MVQQLFPFVKNGSYCHSAGEVLHRVFLPSVGVYMHLFWLRLFESAESITVWSSDQPTVTAQSWCRITWVGHATFLVQLHDQRGSVNILTDPIFGNATILFRRLCAPGLTIEQLPKIDYVLLSHNHRDHMDAPSIRAIATRWPKVLFMVPQGDQAWFERRGYLAQEFVWWQAFRHAGLTATFLPAYHWSGRSLFGRNRSLWGSWALSWQGRTIYFAGDTGYWKHFSNIAAHFPAIDVALMPIGPCEPRGMMERSHLSAEDAVRAFLELGARCFVPMHWGTFRLGMDAPYTSWRRLITAWQKAQHQLDGRRLQLVLPGQVFDPSIRQDGPDVSIQTAKTGSLFY